MADIYASIWEDTYYTGTEDAYDYSVVLNNETIYTGRAYLKPNDNTFSINISKICQDYLSNSLPDFRTYTDSTVVHSNAHKVFELYHDDVLVNSYHYLYCWDYRTSFAGTALVLSNPVNGKYCSGMKTFYTVYNATSGQVETSVKEGVNTGYTKVSCGKGALYYKNRKGGWDSFLIEGEILREDSYDKYSYNHSFNNKTIEFEEGTYHNQITSDYTLHTGWLKDSEAKLLSYNLIPSNMVYFHNFEDDTIIPVVMTNSSVEYKTYHNQGNSLVRYDITIRESQKKQML